MRIPVLWTAEVEDGSREDVEHLLRLERSASSSSVDKELSEKREWYDNGTEAADAGVDGWGGVQPLTVHSLVPDSTPVPATPAPMPVLPPPPTTVLGLLRYGFTTVPQPEREAAPPPTPREREIDRATERRLDDAEPVRVSFMIQMPVLPEEVARERMRRERERDVDEEEAGWRAGMEIGVWEGTVDAADTHASYPPPPQLLPLGERSV
jgi:hypothetical protein